MTSPLVELLKHLDIDFHDVVIPGRGEASTDPTTGFLVVRYTRPGKPGEFKIEAKVSFTAPFVNPNGLPEYQENK